MQKAAISKAMFSQNQELLTYLQIVKTDQSQIPSLLQTIYTDIVNSAQKSGAIDVKTMLQPYFNFCNVFLFGEINFQSEIKKMQASTQSKGVCAKSLHAGDVAWKCETCEKDPTCIICQECFEKGNHKGHKIWLKRNVGGCCDCGDPTAWAEEGFCSSHKGYTTEALLESLPNNIKQAAPFVFQVLGKNLKFTCLEIQRAKETKQFKEQIVARDVAQEILVHIESLIDCSLAFIHYWTEAMNMWFLVDAKFEGHECCERTFLSEEEKSRFIEEMKSIKDKKMSIDEGEEQEQSICTCNVMDLTNQVNHYFLPQFQKFINELWLKMFQSLKFKTILGLSYMANLEPIISNRTSKSVVTLGVQILTIDEIAMMILQSAALRDNIVFVFDILCERLSQDPHSDKHSDCIVFFLYDLKYLIRPQTIKYALNQTNFLESLIHPMVQLYFLDKRKNLTEHIGFDFSVDYAHLKTAETQYIDVMHSFFKELDYMNVKKNQEIMGVFIDAFKQIDQKLKTHENEGFFSIPIHRIFSYYFTRLLMKNFYIIKKEHPQRNDQQIFLEIIKQHIIIPNHQYQQEHIQQTIHMILKPLIRSWGFVQEIVSQKWVYYGFQLQNVATLYYSVFDSYLCLDISLFQMLLCTSPQPEKTVQEMLLNVSFDGWIKTWLHQLIKNQFSVDEFKHQSVVKFDEKKLRMLFGSILKLFIQLAISEVSFIYPINPKKQLTFYQYDTVIKGKIDKMVFNDIKRQLVHVLLAQGGRSDIETIKKQVEKVYLNMDQFEQALEDVSNKVKDAKGKVQFKLKEKEYLSWYDPYYMLQPSKQGKLQESILQFYSDKDEINTLVGDYEGKYKYYSPVNNVIKQCLAKSNLISYLYTVTNIWTDKDKNDFSKQVIDEQTGLLNLKLIILIVQGAQNLDSSIKAQVIRFFKENNQQLLNSLLSLKNGDKHQQQICKYLMHQIYLLDQQEFQQLGEKEGFTSESMESSEESSLNKSTSFSETEQKKQLLKEQALKKKQALMSRFQNKRQNYIDKNVKDHQPQMMKQMSFSSNNEEDEVSIECCLCKETLTKDSYQQQPYGQCAYATKTKLMYHSVQQTIQQQKKWIQQQNYGIHIQEEEEEKKSYELEKKVDQSDITLEYLSERDTGGVLLKCPHFAHHKCLSDYMDSQVADLRKYDLRVLIGFDLDQFQCPLCKQISNTLLPGEVKLDSKQNLDKLMDFTISFYSKLIMCQNADHKQTLITDIRKHPELFLVEMFSFINHRLQIIDLKGMNDYMKSDQRQTGRSDYSLLMESVSQMFPYIYQQQEEQKMEIIEFYHNIMVKSLNNMMVHGIITDFSSITIEMMYFIYLKYSNRGEEYLEKITFLYIQAFYKVFQVQSIIKQVFLQNKGKIQGKYEQILGMFNKENFEKISQDQSIREDYEQSQLPYLRKVTSLYLTMIQNQYQTKQNKKRMEYFITELGLINDDSQEYQILKKFLKLNNDQQLEIDNDISQSDQQLINAIGSEQGIDEQVRILPLSLIKSIYFSEMEVDDQSIIQSQQHFTLPIPDQLLLLTPYFKFQLLELESDFQSFVQNNYKKVCKNCKQQVKENSICLLCGEVQCYLQQCCKGLPQMKPNEGELSYHCRSSEGDCCLFICTGNGQILLMEHGRSCLKQSPYINKYGETFNQRSKKWDNFYIDEETGGKQVYDEYRKMYMNFTLGNEVIQFRSNASTIFRTGQI